MPNPPIAAPRRIVLCLDGTWNSAYDEQHRSDGHTVLKPSNVLKLSRAVLPRGLVSQTEQITYYDIGIGSLAKYPGMANWLLAFADKFVGGIWGAGFEGNIEDALSFLTLNHQEGDSVFIFGFSRGAATARGLTRFLDWSGGLPCKGDAYYLPRLFRAYILTGGSRPCASVLDEINAERAAERKPLPPLAPFQKISVEFLGVWDTVMALGSRFRAVGAGTSTISQSFHVDRKPAQCVQHARQALAIDEARYDFRPEIWSGRWDHQTLEQRWFAGVHSNVGGGYVDDGLANLAFHWILDGATAAGLEIDSHFAGIFRGFAQDRLYRSESLFYRFLDGMRLRFGRGKRKLVEQPEEANLSLDRSVIHRIEADPEERRKDGNLRFPEIGKPYRPKNVLLFLACQPALDQYLKGLGLKEEDLELPADVRAEIAKLRRDCP
jgi:uncharacterized protein (DUF2235 family)